jgi:hypothetical protein
VEEAGQQPVELLRPAEVGRLERVWHDLQPGAGDHPSYKQAAETLILEKGSPVRAPEVVDWMIRKGYRTGENRKFLCNTMYNELGRSSKFLKLGGGLWGLAKEGGTREVRR